ncbi:MAG: hypothetical protein J6Y01_06210 [Spirochaetales bacterium]|nr:hypothetical protein [Spirochaetales bacterium]
MKKISFIIISLVIILTMWACDTECKNNFIVPYYSTTTTTTIYISYDSAGAEIVKKYPIDEAGHFANYQDGKVYVVSQSYLKIFDLTNDTFTMQDKIELKKSDLSGDWNFMRCYGVADLGSEYLILARLDRTNDSIQTLLSVKNDGTDFGFSDLTADIINKGKITSMYYYSDKQTFAVIQDDGYSSLYTEYLYDPTTDTLSVHDYSTAHDYSIINGYYYGYTYYRNYENADLYHSYLDIYKTPDTYNELYFIQTEYLGLNKPILSCFYTGSDFYLFTKENDQYQFIKIKPKKREYYNYD